MRALEWIQISLQMLFLPIWKDSSLNFFGSVRKIKFPYKCTYTINKTFETNIFKNTSLLMLGKMYVFRAS